MASVRVTWWGHSTVAIEDRGLRLLTDPLLRTRLGHLRRRRGPVPEPGAEVDAVLVSHLHADHLDVASLRRLPSAAMLIVPRGAAAFLRQCDQGLARRCQELAVGEEVSVGHLRVRAVPARHNPGRGPWSRHRAPAIGYTVHGGRSAWFAGDTGLFDEMDDLGPLDVALVPVGGWGPTLGSGHLDPAAAAEAVRRMGAKWAVPVHFGTFWPMGMEQVRPDRFLGPGAEFARLAAMAAPATRVRVLAPGEGFSLTESSTGEPRLGAGGHDDPVGPA
jgi:L-ascorbate metabolism protein UlaG (beta-lactamase superfamily)